MKPVYLTIDNMNSIVDREQLKRQAGRNLRERARILNREFRMGGNPKAEVSGRDVREYYRGAHVTLQIPRALRGGYLTKEIPEQRRLIKGMKDTYNELVRLKFQMFSADECTFSPGSYKLDKVWGPAGGGFKVDHKFLNTPLVLVFGVILRSGAWCS